MAEEYNLKDLVYLILNKIVYIILAMIVFASVTFSISKFVISPQYQSNVSLYVCNTDDRQSQNINSSDLTVAKSLVSTYIVILSNDVVMDEISDRLMKNHSEDELRNYFTIVNGHVTNGSLKSCYSMSAVNSTEVLRITATTKNAELSQELCNIMADIAPDFLIRVVGAGSVEKIGDAKLYPNKVSPNVTKNTAVGGLAGIVLTIAIIFLIDFFDNTIKDVSGLQESTQKPILGEIPHIGGKVKKKTIGTYEDRKKRLLFDNKDIPFSVVESYKSMRTNVMFSLSTAENKVLAVTSSLPSAGKSITIANLAVTMAQTDKKILLIDADMRKPVQHRNFQLANKKGLSSVLSGDAEFNECVNKDVVKNLDIMTAGVIPPNPSELLASDKMRSFIEEVKKIYDYILVDTPPVLPMTDVIGISDIIAGVAVVVSYAETTYSEMQELQTKLENGNCNLSGFILNNVTESSKKGGYGYKYKYKYKYKYGYNGYGGYGYGYGYGHSHEEDDKKNEEEKNIAENIKQTKETNEIKAETDAKETKTEIKNDNVEKEKTDISKEEVKEETKKEDIKEEKESEKKE